jgi:hypothetical protein
MIKKLILTILIVLMAAPAALAGISNMSALDLTAVYEVDDSPVLKVTGTDGTTYLEIDNAGNVYAGADVFAKDAWTAPLVANDYGCTSTIDADNINWEYAGGVGATASDSGAITQPDYARNITVTCSDVATCTGNITVTGIDAQGRVISEVFYFNNGGDSGNTAIEETQSGTQAFARITAIVGDATFITNADTYDTLAVGTGDKLGLQADILNDTGYKVLEAGVDVDPRNVTIDGVYDTVDFVAASDGSTSFAIFYKTNRITIKP